MSEMKSFNEVLAAALKLSVGQRELLADLLLGSLETDLPLSEAWVAEIELRSREFDENPSSGMSWDEVKANARRLSRRE